MGWWEMPLEGGKQAMLFMQGEGEGGGRWDCGEDSSSAEAATWSCLLRRVFALEASILESHTYSFGNVEFLHLFPTIKLLGIGLPGTRVMMAVRMA